MAKTHKKKPIAYIGKETKSYVHEETRITLPNEKVFVALQKELALSPNGLRALKLVLGNIKEDLDNIASVQRSTKERKDLIKHLKDVAKPLRALQLQCERRRAVINTIMPADARAALGLALTFSTMSQTLGRSLYPENFNAQMERMLNEGQLISVETIEAYYAPKREALGLEHGGEFFCALIRSVHQAFEAWRESHKVKNFNSGQQRTPRNHVLYWLIYEAEEILGVERVSQPGQIFRLCAAVIRCVGLKENGLRSAVTRMKITVEEEKMAHAAGV